MQQGYVIREETNNIQISRIFFYLIFFFGMYHFKVAGTLIFGSFNSHKQID